MHTFHTVQFVPTTANKHQSNVVDHTYEVCGCFLPSRYSPQFKNFQLEHDDFNRILKKANQILSTYQELIDKEVSTSPTNLSHSPSSTQLDSKGMKGIEVNRKKLLLILAIVSLVPTFGISLMIYKLWPKILQKKHEQKISKLRERCRSELTDLIMKENENLKKLDIQLELTFGPLKYPIFESQEEEEEKKEMEEEEEEERTGRTLATSEDYNDGSYILKRNKSENQLTKSQLLGFLSKKKHSTSTANQTVSSSHSHDNLPMISVQSSKKRILDVFEEECIPSIQFNSNNRKSAYLMDFIRNAQRSSMTPSTPVAMFKRNFSDVEQMASSMEESTFFPSELKNYHFDYNDFHPLNPNYQKI